MWYLNDRADVELGDWDALNRTVNSEDEHFTLKHISNVSITQSLSGDERWQKFAPLVCASSHLPASHQYQQPAR
jgi:hypothetical protein